MFRRLMVTGVFMGAGLALVPTCGVGVMVGVVGSTVGRLEAVGLGVCVGVSGSLG